MDPIPVPLQTLHAELADQAWRASLTESLPLPGSAYATESRGKRYWYWRGGSKVDGKRPSPVYVGPDTPETRKRIDDLKAGSASARERRSMVAALKAARLPGPDPVAGRVLRTFERAGVFRLRACLVGSHAMTCYPGVLGYRVPGAAVRTGDLDIAQFHSVSVAVEDAIPDDLLDVLKEADGGFEAVPWSMDGRRVQKYELKRAGRPVYAVDVLCPRRGAERPAVTHLPAIRSDAQVLKFLDFLVHGEIETVALHGEGIAVRVPAPERYAVHKMLVAGMRAPNPVSQAKGRKDLEQSVSLLRVLIEDRADALRDVVDEARGRGPAWRTRVDEVIATLPDDLREFLG